MLDLCLWLVALSMEEVADTCKVSHGHWKKKKKGATCCVHRKRRDLPRRHQSMTVVWERRRKSVRNAVARGSRRVSSPANSSVRASQAAANATTAGTLAPIAARLTRPAAPCFFLSSGRESTE